MAVKGRGTTEMRWLTEAQRPQTDAGVSFGKWFTQRRGGMQVFEFWKLVHVDAQRNAGVSLGNWFTQRPQTDASVSFGKWFTQRRRGMQV
jgi:hypothetical protein